MRARAFKDRSGEVQGRLTIISRGPNTTSNKIQWHCLCACGQTPLVRADSLRNNHTQSCGCLQREVTSRRARTHGHAGCGKNYTKRSPEYKSWMSMVQRTKNPKNPKWSRYGGRGISMDDRWLNFEIFLGDMGARPSLQHSIERKDNDGDYTPDNCYWATRQQQSINKATSIMVMHEGIMQSLATLSRARGVNIDTARGRFKKGASVAQAISNERLKWGWRHV